jgi:hypothetical protein
MRRGLGWLTGVVSVAALAKLLRRRQRRPTPAPPPTDDPAAELRETLARAREPEREPEDAEPAAETTSTSPEERRSQVHERAQETIGRMRDSSEEAEP